MVEQGSSPLDFYTKANGRNLRTFKVATYSSSRSSNMSTSFGLFNLEVEVFVVDKNDYGTCFYSSTSVFP